MRLAFRVAAGVLLGAILALPPLASARAPAIALGQLNLADYSNGVIYEEFGGDFNLLPDFDALGSPRFVGTSPTIFIEGFNKDYFARRYRALLKIDQAGDYVFYLNSDDGSQLFLGNDTIPTIDNDGLHAPRELASAPIFLEAGYHRITVTFFESAGGETLELSYSSSSLAKTEIPEGSLFFEQPSPVTVPPDIASGPLDTANYAAGVFYEEFFGDFFAVPDFDSLGGLRLTGVSPDYSIGELTSRNLFARRYEAYLEIEQAGVYRFYTTSDDGSQLLLGSTMIVDNDGQHAEQERGSFEYRLSRGYYQLTATFFERYGGELLEVSYEGPGISKQPIPATRLSYRRRPAPPAPTALNPTDLRTRDAIRLLTQATFGPTPEAVNDVIDLGVNSWIRKQMDPAQTPISAHSVELYSNDERRDRWWYIAINGDDQLRQRVAFALSEIFVVSDREASLANRPEALTSYMDMLARNAFGNYRDLLEDVTLHPAMGLYLSMIRNRAPAPGISPDENYAREVLQLKSIGLDMLAATSRPLTDADGKTIPTYDQAIVTGFAHVFTGWTYSNDIACDFDVDPESLPDGPNVTDPMVMCENYHDIEAKRILDHGNNPPGLCDQSIADGCFLPAGQTGAQDLEDALNNIARHPNVAPFISRQLIQRLVTSNPSRSYVRRVATVFERSRGDLAQVISRILLDREARNPSFPRTPYFGKVREPLLAFTHLYRAFDLYIAPEEDEPEGFFRFERDDNESQSAILGQAPMSAPSVFNFFSPFHDHPGITSDFGLKVPELKIVTDATVVSVANALYDRLRDVGHSNLDIGNELALLASQNGVERLIDHLDALLMAGQMPTHLRDSVRELLEANNWLALERVHNAIYLIMTSPDYMVQR